MQTNNKYTQKIKSEMLVTSDRRKHIHEDISHWDNNGPSSLYVYTRSDRATTEIEIAIRNEIEIDGHKDLETIKDISLNLNTEEVDHLIAALKVARKIMNTKP